jgi:hypothetical protein
VCHGTRWVFLLQNALWPVFFPNEETGLTRRIPQVIPASKKENQTRALSCLRSSCSACVMKHALYDIWEHNEVFAVCLR